MANSTTLDRARIESVIEAITERLDGEWLLVGGALVALWLEPRRTTEDVDIMGLAGTPNERYVLMDLAVDLGLPVEAVNSAADFFVRRVEGWRDELQVLRRGARSTVYRPTPTLFVLLKIARLSERDLADCEAAVSLARSTGLALDDGRLRTALDALAATDEAGLAGRRARLRALLEPAT